MKYYLPILFFLLSACSQTGQGDLLEIAIETNRDSSLPLSEITDEMMAVELELTGESLINPDIISRIIITDNNIIVIATSIIQPTKPLVFNKDGKFIRSIGSRGQGPGEFNIILTVAFDEQSKRLFIVSAMPNKIICYDLDGFLLKESRYNSNWSIGDINYINGELFLDCMLFQNIEDNYKSVKTLYRMNENFQITDSCIRWENYWGQVVGDFHKPGHCNYIVKNNTSIYIYSPETYIKSHAPRIKVLRDTLYRWEDNHLVPDLKLKFRNDGFDREGDKIIDLYNIYRSTRYIFAMYDFNPDNKQRNTEKPKTYYFCYDTKTGKGYNIPEGYTDDINGIEKPVSIHPLHTGSETFYYWHTHMKPGDREEPNPTLYIIKLKK